MANEVPGVARAGGPDRSRMRRAGGPEAAAAEGIAIAARLAAELKGRVQGIQIGTSAERIDAAVALVAGLI